MKKYPRKVFIQEDNNALQQQISEELKNENYLISFFSKLDSIFDLLNLNPDIIIQDYKKNKILRCVEWSTPYNN
jgi:DNA-binding response OmpR family regulator